MSEDLTQQFQIWAGITPQDEMMRYMSKIKVVPSIYVSAPILMVSVEDFEMLMKKKCIVENKRGSNEPE